MRNVIVLVGKAREGAGIASAAINPGNLIEMTPGTTKSWRKHSVAGGSVMPFAIARNVYEDEGDEISAAIAQGSSFTPVFPGWGDEVQVRCVDTVARSDKLVSAGDGTVKKRTAETIEAAVGVALAANADGWVSMIVGGAQSTDISV